MTTEITSLPQLTPEGLPLALVRRAAEQTRMARAATELAERGEAVTSRALAAAAHLSLNTTCTWLRQREIGTMGSAAALSVLQYSSYSTSDNMPASENNTSAITEIPERVPASVDPPAAASSLPVEEPLVPALPALRHCSPSDAGRLERAPRRDVPMNPHSYRPPEPPPRRNRVSGFAFNLERLAGPAYFRRMLVSDITSGSSGRGSTPRGVPLPELQAARQGLTPLAGGTGGTLGHQREDNQPP